MEKHDLTPEQSLAIISKSIANFKMNYRESARFFLLWGWMLTFASFSNFVILRILHAREAYELMGPLSLANWGLFILIGFVVQFFMNRQINRNKKVYSHLDGYIRNLWIVAAVGFFVGTLICIQLDIIPPPIMLLIAGIATTASGVMIKFRPVILGGVAFFVFSIATSFVNNEYIALLTGLAILCGYVIPGYYLKSAKE
jgi:hypothetical protein